MILRDRLKISRVGKVLLAMIAMCVVGYLRWSPGSYAALPTGRTHAAWLSHAWWAEPRWQGLRAVERGLMALAGTKRAAV